MKRMHALSFLLVGAALVVGACDASPAVPVGPGFAAHSLVMPLSGPCPSDGTGGPGFSDEVDSLHVVVTGTDLKAAVEATGALGAVTVPKIPAGKERNVGVFGLSSGTAVWRGAAQHVTINADADTAVDVLLGRIADVTCARSTSQNARAFHTATRLLDGRVLIVGGAKDSSDASATCGTGCRRMTATSSMSIYDPHTGAFIAVGNLSTGRMFHTATLLKDGRVVIAGGASEVLVHVVDNAHPFPIEPTVPVAGIEVYDPAKASVSSAGDDPNGARVFAAATADLDGNALITGGVPGRGSPINDLSNAVATSTLCSGTPLSCVNGPALSRPRAGHQAFTIDPDGVFLWGGSVSLGVQGGLPGFQMESLPAHASAFAGVDVAAMNNERNVFFAAGAQYVDFRMLSAGGLVRDSNGTFHLASVTVDGASKAPVYIFDVTASTHGGIATGGTVPMHLGTPRFLGGASGLVDEKRALIAGGYASLGFAPSNELAIYDESNLTVNTINVGGTARSLREGRGGLTVTSTADGNVILVGGEAANGNAAPPLSTVEVFSDPVTPAFIGGAP